MGEALFPSSLYGCFLMASASCYLLPGLYPRGVPAPLRPCFLICRPDGQENTNDDGDDDFTTHDNFHHSPARQTEEVGSGALSFQMQRACPA